jgi:phosphoglycerate dehydrogenase-like enzyme
LGLVGLGRIGQAVAVRAAAFRMRVLAREPFPDAEFVRQHQIDLVPLERLLAESDFVSLHVPLSKDTRHLIDRRALALMKPTAFLINTARGDVVCEGDLVRALQERRIAGAGLDVFAQEPLPADHPLLKLDNVVCTAHTAGTDSQALDDMALLAAGSIVALSQGQWPEAQVVNPESRTRFRWP